MPAVLIRDEWSHVNWQGILSDNETSLLCKGLGYTVTSKKVPIVDIITTTESVIKLRTWASRGTETKGQLSYT